ncbi:MAG: Yop proteins translocation protein Q [bacterium ADurb.Bin270]|jgi:type III secretion system YscQ/HrcQ family protein|nr:hypothetical protein [Myxococcales bacterium]OQA58837.1 MAG: Yop proteins translocation protein Q [bacterium ADurb.Bin270]HQG14212.1 FliM/FliN family flagellar motor switch protein [bacterium]HQH80567.1 FliM/FliN family flagellar motor switch protein [bacterium]
MKKRDGDSSQELSLEEDMDIFDELESGDSSADDDIDVPVIEEEKTEPDTPHLFSDEVAEDGEADDFEITEQPPLPSEEGAGHSEDFEEEPSVSEKIADEPASVGLAHELMKLAPDIPVNIVAVIGKTMSNIGDVVKYRPGQVIDLARPPSETVDLVANGKLIARGELVDMDGRLGVRILKLLR